MPNFEEIVEALPEEAKGIIKAAFLSANPIAGIRTKEEAFDFIGKTPLFKAASDETNRKAIESHSAKFMAEKFPDLVDAEIKKRDPKTDPIRAELDKIKSELAEEKASAKRERLLVKAMEIATKEGVPTVHIKRFLEDDEDATVTSVNAFIKDWKDTVNAGIEKGLKGQFGNNGSPKSGKTTEKAITIKDFTALSPKEQAAKMKDGYTLIEE